MNAVDALAGQLAVQRQLISDATLQQLLARSRSGAGPVTQLLLRDRLLDGAIVGELISAVNQAQVLCPGCGATAVPSQLDPSDPLACPRCRTTLIVAAPGQGDTRSDSKTASHQRPDPRPDVAPVTRGSSRKLQAPFDSRQIRSATGSARFAGDPTGSMRFKHAMKEGGSIGPFEILDELGRGGMGVVYKARHIGRGELVALKVLRAGTLASKKQRKRFEREVQAMARLDHPNVVPVRDVGALGENKYFTMALIDGRSLGDMIKTERLPIRRAAEIARDVARGLQHAHEDGIIHRDIKPDNILLDRGGRALITDFGLVHDADADERLTKSGALVGTPYYMAPEQARGKRDLIGPQSDLHSLGVVLFQMLTGDLPFRGKTQIELIERIIKQNAPLPSSVNPEVPKDLDLVVRACMHKAPADRYPTAGDMADDLERFLSGRRVLALGAAPPLARWAAAALAVVGALVLGAGVVNMVMESRRRQAELEAKAAEAAAAKKLQEKRRAELQAAYDQVTSARQAALREPLGPAYRVALSQLNSTLSRALLLAPEDPKLLLERGRVSEHLHLYEEAHEAYRATFAQDTALAGGEALARHAWLSKRRSVDAGALNDELSKNNARLGPDAGPWKDVVFALALLFRAKGPEDLTEPLSLVKAARRDEPGLGFAWALEAQVLYMSGDPESAVTALERAIQLLPREPLLLANRGVLNAARNRMSEAQADLKAALEIDPQLGEALALRGRLRLAEGDLEGAIADLEAVHQEDPDDVSAMLMLARVYRLAKQPGRCDDLLSQAEQADPSNEDVYRIRVGLHLQEIELDQALRTLRRGLTKVSNPAAKRRLHRRLVQLGVNSNREDFLQDYARELEAANPRDARPYEIRGQLLANKERFAEAEAVFARGAELDPRYEPVRETLLRVRFQRDRNNPAVRAQTNRFLEDLSDDADALCYGVNYHMALTRKKDRARALADKAVRIAPGNSRSWETRALVAALEGNLPEAFKNARQAVMVDPDNYEAHHMLGEVMLQRGNMKAAMSSWLEALSINPFKEESADRVALGYLSQRQPQNSVEFCQSQMKLAREARRPAPSFIKIHLANGLIETRKPEQAKRLVDSVLLEPPRDLDQRRNLAMALARLNRLTEAKSLLQAVVAEDPTDKVARELLLQVESAMADEGR